MKDKRVLILGGGGFIGKSLVKELQKSGYIHVSSVSRSVGSADVTKKSSIERWIREADIVINLAGYVSFFKKDLKILMEINHRGALNVLELCEKYDKRLIHIASSAALGFSDEIIDENSNFDWKKYKFLSYSYSKFLPLQAIKESKVFTNIIYPPFVIGKEGAETIRLFDYVKGKNFLFIPQGENAFIDIADLSRAIRLVLEKADRKDDFIVKGGDCSYLDLFRTTAKRLGQNTKIIKIPKSFEKIIVFLVNFLEKIGLSIPAENIYLGFKKRNFDSSKIEDKIGFKPEISLEQSLKVAFSPEK